MSVWTSPIMRRLRPGVAATLGQTEPYREWWERHNEGALAETGPLWVALGDSTGQGIGASAPWRGYVGQLLERFRARDARSWRVVNLSVTGARIADALTVQIPRLAALGERERPQLVTCAAGANDMFRLRFGEVPHTLRELISALPRGAVIATLPQGLSRRRTTRLNDMIRAEAPAAGLRVADTWAHTGPPWSGKYAADSFHPNDRGYTDWCDALAETLGLDGP